MSEPSKRFMRFGSSQSYEFDDFMNKIKAIALVIIVQPGCPHCDALEPTIDYFQQKYDEPETEETSDKPKIVVLDSGALDRSSISEVKNITGVPTIMTIKNKKKVADYTGDRSKKSLKNYLKSIEEGEQESDSVNKKTITLYGGGRTYAARRSSKRIRKTHKRRMNKRRTNRRRHRTNRRRHRTNRRRHRTNRRRTRKAY